MRRAMKSNLKQGRSSQGRSSQGLVIPDPCRIPDRYRGYAESVLTDDALPKGWIGRLISSHAAACPRCRARLMKLGRVSLGLSLLRGQRQPANLLGESNRMALQKMRRSVRYSPQADALRVARPRVSPWIRVADTCKRTVNAAACVLVILLLRTVVENQVRETTELGEKLAAYHEATHIYGHESDWA